MTALPLRVPPLALLPLIALLALVCGAYLSARQLPVAALLIAAFAAERAAPLRGIALALAAAPFCGRAPGWFDPHVAALSAALLAALLRAVKPPAGGRDAGAAAGLVVPRWAALGWGCALVLVAVASLAAEVVPALVEARPDAQELVQGALVVTVTAPLHAVYACFLLVLWVTLAGVVVARARSGDAARLVRALLGAHAATLAVGFLDHAGVLSLTALRPISSVIAYSPYPHRLVSLFWHPSWYAQWLVLMLPLALGAAWRARGGARAACLVLAAATAIALPITYQRGGWVAGAAAALVMAAAWVQRAGVAGLRRRRRVIAGWCAGVALGSAALVAITGQAGLVAGRAREVDHLSGREILWRGAVVIFRERPWLGHGHDTFGWVYPRRYAPGDPDYYGQHGTAHNGYLQLATGTGVLGLAAFLALCGSALATAWRTLRAARSPDTPLVAGCAAALIGYLTYALVQEFFHIPALGTVFWLLVGLIGALQLPGRQQGAA